VTLWKIAYDQFRAACKRRTTFGFSSTIECVVSFVGSKRFACLNAQSQLGGATAADAFAYSKLLKMYPLSEAANPKPRFVDVTQYPLHTLPFYDI
jgi:hypothetical protein